MKLKSEEMTNKNLKVKQIKEELGTKMSSTGSPIYRAKVNAERVYRDLLTYLLSDKRKEKLLITRKIRGLD